jgi:hypothetical protein
MKYIALVHGGRTKAMADVPLRYWLAAPFGGVS